MLCANRPPFPVSQALKKAIAVSIKLIDFLLMLLNWVTWQSSTFTRGLLDKSKARVNLAVSFTCGT